jgi:hypothetical protein
MTNEVVSALDLISSLMNTVLDNVSSVAAALEPQDAVPQKSPASSTRWMRWIRLPDGYSASLIASG